MPFLVAALAFVLALTTGRAAAFDPVSPPPTPASAPEEFVGILVGSAQTGPQRITVRVDDYSQISEIASIAELGARKGQQEVLSALIRADSAGWVRLGTGLRFQVPIIRSTPTENGRKVLVLTDRSIAFWEQWTASPTLDYPFGVIVLELNRAGEGEGSLLPAVRAVFLPNGNVVLEDYAVQPLRIVSVERRDAD